MHISFCETGLAALKTPILSVLQTMWWHGVSMGMSQVKSTLHSFISIVISAVRGVENIPPRSRHANPSKTPSVDTAVSTKKCLCRLSIFLCAVWEGGAAVCQHMLHLHYRLY